MSADCGCGPETYERDGEVYTVVHTDAYAGELGSKWTRRGAQKLADRSNAERRAPSVRYEVRHKGTFRWVVVALQNQLVPPGSVPDRTPPRLRAVFDVAEDVIEADLGLPATWRCPCGGKPFVGHSCPRCGSTQTA